jgi:hypothetical protein
MTSQHYHVIVGFSGNFVSLSGITWNSGYHSSVNTGIKRHIINIRCQLLSSMKKTFSLAVMPLWHNEGRFETSVLQGAQSIYRTKKVGKQTQRAQRVVRLFCKC